MGLDPIHSRPELFIWTALPIPPLCIRPSVGQENARYDLHI
jgi:DNA-directed RNA polymerase III subunit RPC1